MKAKAMLFDLTWLRVMYPVLSHILGIEVGKVFKEHGGTRYEKDKNIWWAFAHDVTKQQTDRRNGNPYTGTTGFLK